MHAAKNDEFCILLLGGAAGEFKAVADEIGLVDDRVLLIMMPQDDEPFSQRLPARRRCAAADPNRRVSDR